MQPHIKEKTLLVNMGKMQDLLDLYQFMPNQNSSNDGNGADTGFET